MKPSAETPVIRPSRFSAIVPSPATVLAGSTIWGAAMAVAAGIGLYVRDELLVLSPGPIVLLFFAGAALGFAPGLLLSELLSGRGRPLRRFIVGTIVLTLATHTATAGLFALQYRMFYAHWHADFPSLTWAFQFAFTSASALYQYTVDSRFVYLPAAPPLFLLLGLWFARRAH